MSTIAIINKVFDRDGAAAAAERADVLGEGWAARKIRAGEWNRQPTKKVGIEVPLGNKGDVALHAVKIDGKVTKIVKTVRGESGEAVSVEVLDTTSIVEAINIIL